MKFTTEARRGRAVLCFFATALCFVSLAVSAQTAKAPSVDEIVAKHIQARGGREKLKSLQTLRTQGTLTLGSRGEAKLTREIKRPNMVRTDFALGTITLVHAYDGHDGWQIGPDGKTAPLTGDDLKNAEEDADIEGPLVDYKQKGNKVEFAGTSSVNDSTCYNLKITFANGDVFYECVDAKSYLVVGQRAERNGQVQVEAVLGDYRSYDGIQFAGTSDVRQAGNPEPVHYRLEKVEVNPPIDDSRFKAPQ